MRLSFSRMTPSRYAAEILSAIRNNDQAELQRRLADAASGCRPTPALASFEAESFAALDACVETLQSGEDVSEARRYATLQILRHLAEGGEQEIDHAVSDSRKFSICRKRCFPSLTM